MTKKSLFSSCIVAALFSTPFFLGSCRNDPKVIARIQIPDTISGQFITNGEIIYSELGKVKTRIKSPEIYNFETQKKYTEMPKGFYAEFFDAAGNVEASIQAEYGIFRNDEDKMEAKRDVEVLSFKDNEQLNTEKLIWDLKSKKIYTDAFVKMTSKDKILFGDGFVSDENFENRSITKLRGEILVEKETK